MMKNLFRNRLWLLAALICALLALSALADTTIPASTTVIETEAFQFDASLTGPLVLPEGLVRIGDRAFEGCFGLTEALVIPEGVQYIGSRAFADCTGLSGTVRIPDSVTYLADDAFDGTPVTLVFGDEEGITTDTDLPGGDTIITMTDLPEGIAYEMTDAGCVITGYTGRMDAVLTIPESVSGIPVVAIGDYAFQDCFELTGGITLPDTVTRIGTGAFFGCSSLDGTLTIPDSVVSIGDYAFFECLSLTGSLTLPASVETVGESAFAYCEGMTGSLSLPADVTLGARCFQGSGFTGAFHVPASMTLGPNVFTGTKLDITWEAPGFTYEQVSTIVTVTGWNGPVDAGLTIPLRLGTGLVTGIAAEAFADIGLEGAVVIPSSVVFIGESAFSSNPGVTSVTFSEGLTTISAYAFADTGLSGLITLPSTVTSLDDEAFAGCNVTIEIAPAEDAE